MCRRKHNPKNRCKSKAQQRKLKNSKSVSIYRPNKKKSTIHHNSDTIVQLFCKLIGLGAAALNNHITVRHIIAILYNFLRRYLTDLRL